MKLSLIKGRGIPFLTPFVWNLWRHRQLIIQMTKREVIGRYKGSFLGLAWSFFNPIFMLLVYTFVFSVVFKARWGVTTDEPKSEFALILFVGMIVHALFSEPLNRAPNLIVSNVNYVKKVVFPLDLLPVISMGSVVFHAVVSIIVFLVAYFFINGHLVWTIVFIPVVLAPLVILSLGLTWFLSSFGVFFRDIGQAVSIITTVLMFLSPVFYPITAVPESFRQFILINPLTFIIEQSREILIWGHLPDWSGLGVYLFVSLLIAGAGYAWFQKTRKGFADVL